MQQVYDFVIVGSGAGSVPAALVMKERGLRPLIIEKLPVIGGTTAYSGGVVWLPDNPIGCPNKGADALDLAAQYMKVVAGESADEVDPLRREAYIRGGADLVNFLTGKGMRFVDVHWPDYHDEMAGGVAGGRSLAVPLFDVNELGEWADKLASYSLTADFPVVTSETASLLLAKKTWRGKLAVLRLAWRMLMKKLLAKDLRGAGPALQGRLFQIALREQVAIWTESAVVNFMVENNRVCGVRVQTPTGEMEVVATRGVLINAGGFARNLAMREKYLPQPTSTAWTQVNPGDTGEIIQAAVKLGAKVKFMDEAWWLPSSYYPDGRFGGFHSPNDIGKPHCIVVDQQGRRFANEAAGYVEFGQKMYTANAVPAWAVFDSRHRRSYPWGMLLPGASVEKLVVSGYMVRADSLAALATQCGINAASLAITVERYNRFATIGKDEDYLRGESAYNRYYGDPTVSPNPNLGTLEQAPFYAVRIYPGDVGTAGGLDADQHGRVLNEDGICIPGLYVTGNSSAAVTGRCYPGAGASIGPSMVFGYLAARHAAGWSAH